MAFGETFGELTPGHPIHAAPDDRDEVLVVDTREAKVTLGYGERDPFSPPRRTITGWHTDITFVANPANASILRGVVIPPYGGDTLWTNLVAAYEDLSLPVRNFIDGLQAVHVWHGYDGVARVGHDSSKPPSAVHPVVRVHPITGEKALFVNPVFTRYVVGLSDRESAAILGVLFEQMERPQFQVRFRWEPDSIAFWDNRATARTSGPRRSRHRRVRPPGRAGHRRRRRGRRARRLPLSTARGRLVRLTLRTRGIGATVDRLAEETESDHERHHERGP